VSTGVDDMMLQIPFGKTQENIFAVLLALSVAETIFRVAASYPLGSVSDLSSAVLVKSELIPRMLISNNG